MDYHEDYQPQRQPNRSGGKNDNDLGAWLLIGVMFLVAWPVGLILLIKKLTDNPQKLKKAASGTADYVRARAQDRNTAQSAVNKVTQTPRPSAGGARTLKIIGIILAALGGAAMMRTAFNDLSFAIEYDQWWYFLRQLFYPTGLLAGGLALLTGGSLMNRKMRRYAKYLACAGKQNAIPLAHFMKAANVGESKAERDLEAMVEKGMWGPEAYLDRGNDMLFRTQAAANEYFSARRGQAAAAQQQAAESAAQPQAEGYEGMLGAIRRANDRIDDPTLSAKIDRLEAITVQIFKVIREEPQKKSKAGTFLNYYLPTTQKLLDSYADFEEAGVSGENLGQAKARIEETMDNIIVGFEHQLDELYRDAAMDIDSDIRVMETMLKRDTASAAADFGLDGATAVQMPDTEVE